MNDIEKKMLEHGFTGKDLRIFRHYLQKDALLTHLVLLHELRKRFFVMLMMSFIVLLFCLFQQAHDGDDSWLPCLLTFAIYACIAWFMTPMGLAFKAFRFLKKYA
ncbi:hypothetical protein [Lelliottia sp. CFBP8978]|uniref:hypothetical protein n=1 Tax=Lelliottia sp. CFBP8978 TaxID=3096522 RepID=UPI002A6A1CDE|nr:hypothetical protein [Lelliottia sp. CFBP8978]MDY1036979.1 hypothetical protein [Lelliottia sp. CFBP8978]